MTGRRRGPRTGRPSAAAVVPAVLAVLFFAIPLAGMLRSASWSTLWDDLTTKESLTALRLSLVCSLAAAALSLLLGLPLAWVLARARLPGRSVIRAVVLLPMVLPPVVGGVALLSAFSRKGLVGSFLFDRFGLQLTFTTWGTILAGAFVSMPFLVLTLEGAFRTVDRDLEEAAATLGAGPLTVFRRVTIPVIAPSLVAGTALAWARALGEFGATITFAGNIEGTTRTLPLSIYLLHDTDPEQALALSIVLLAVSLAVMVALRDRWLGTGTGTAPRSGGGGEGRP